MFSVFNEFHTHLTKPEVSSEPIYVAEFAGCTSTAVMQKRRGEETRARTRPRPATRARRAIQHNVDKVAAVVAVRKCVARHGMPFPLAKRPHIQIELSDNLGGGRRSSLRRLRFLSERFATSINSWTVPLFTCRVSKAGIGADNFRSSSFL